MSRLRPPPRRLRARSSRRGVSALAIALALVVLLGFVALVVDLGYARLVQTQLQAGTDAAAMGAVRVLDSTATGVELAREVAVDIAGANRAMGTDIVVEPNVLNTPGGGVVLGHWDKEVGGFTPSLDPTEVNSVQVLARRDDIMTWFSLLPDPLVAVLRWGRAEAAAEAILSLSAADGPRSIPTAALQARGNLSITATSLVVQGGALGAGSVPYYLTFALPQCQVEAHSGEDLLDMTFTLSPAGSDNMGWAAVGGNPSASWEKNHIDEIMDCVHEWADDGKITTPCSPIASGSSVNLGNGVETSVLKHLGEALADGVPWDSSRWGPLPARHSNSDLSVADYGNVIEGPVPIFDGGAVYCTGSASWNETLPIVGYAWGVIYDVASKGSASTKNAWVRVDLTHKYWVGTWYGGENYGVVYAGPPVLVR